MAYDKEFHPTYTLGSPAVRTGLGGLSMATTAVLLCGMLAFILCSLAGITQFAFVGVLPITALLALVTYIKIGGRNLATVAQMTIQDLVRNNVKENEFVSGGLSPAPGGTFKLPGILAATRLVVGDDLRGDEFVMIVDDNFAEVTVILDVQLSGQVAVTQDERNQMTAAWGGWLASLSLSGDIRSASVTVTTKPSSGELIRQEVDRLVADQAPEFAHVILREAADNLASGLPETSAYAAVTFKVPRHQLADGSFASVVATRLDSLTSPLAWAGMRGRVMDCAQVCAVAHSAFNPASEVDFEQLAVQGKPHGLSWNQVGPGMAVTERGVYRHESVVSRTWEMVSAPRSNFEDRVLTHLLAPHSRVLRKRVTLLYRPFEAGVGARRVEAEHQDALVAANAGRGAASARAEVRLEQTQSARRAQARGAQLGRYSLLVTATMDHDDELSAVSEDIRQLAATSGIRLSVAKRQQDTAFCVGLGLGSAPWQRSSVIDGFGLMGGRRG